MENTRRWEERGSSQVCLLVLNTEMCLQKHSQIYFSPKFNDRKVSINKNEGGFGDSSDPYSLLERKYRILLTLLRHLLGLNTAVELSH